MLRLSFKNILKCLQVDNDSPEDVIINKISTNSREIKKGCLFVALKGDSFDGHDFVQEALEQGAVAAIIDNAEVISSNTILVKDTKLALLKLAGLYRETLKTKIVAVTGSVGKTTTKELIALVFSTVGKTFKTKANLNNEIGLSEMIFNIDDSYDYAVLELGVDAPGQMAPMSLAVAADVAVVTNIGESHIMAFKTRENIKKEKLDIKLGLKNKDLIILNGDDALLKSEHGLSYAIDNKQADLLVGNIKTDSLFTSFSLTYKQKTYNAELAAIGKHNVLNSAAAILTSAALGLTIEEGIKALSTYNPEGMRQKIVKVRDFTIVEDSYNASPTSVKAAIETLSEMNTNGSKIMVLADMLELGDEEKRYHQEIGKLLAENNIDVVYTTGSLAHEIYKSAKKNGLNKAFYYKDKQSLALVLNKELKQNDIVWFKASRGMRLEEVIAKIY